MKLKYKKIFNTNFALFTLIVVITIIAYNYVTKDIPRDVSKNVVSFNMMDNGDSTIYATGFHITHRGKTFIITNRHVCEVGIETSGNPYFLTVGDKKAKIIKIWDSHDLCALESWKDEGLILASNSALPLDKVILVGHPRGLPLVVREGRIVGDEKICTGPKTCNNAILISATAYPGNSGSPVTNEYGEVIGVLFAGHGSVFGINVYPNENFIVPYSYLKEFLDYLTVKEEDKLFANIIDLKHTMNTILNDIETTIRNIPRDANTPHNRKGDLK